MSVGRKREATVVIKLPHPVEAKQVPVLRPDGALSKGSFQVDLGKKAAASKVL